MLIKTSLHLASLIWAGVFACLMFNVRQPSDSFRIGIVVPIYVAEFQRQRVYLANASKYVERHRRTHEKVRNFEVS